ncbi:universal stress protein [Desulfallas sp. Bu1-1]|uniref:universal stress protein n=1 Tax=Desulfallas sp. Bu1-1 TaxID=2787620 RepID=UPI00189C5B3B|nr:universal stress protein [Desulfallas sp. Bu1-1]MBF7084520.1 universal stress protein [Desulfallas sp. Bu1-1]
MFKKILLPVDGSLGSSLAVEYCLELLQNISAHKVTLMNITEMPSQLQSYSGKMGRVYNQIKEQLEVHGEEILRKEAARFTEKKLPVIVETKLVWGDPPYSIVREAREGGYDLIIMGSRGLSGLESFLLGSISNHVVQHAECTVIIVKKKSKCLKGSV